MEREDFKSLFKLIIIGNSNSGKSSFLQQFIEGKCIVV
jgi:GTPase SAR1 family protein